MRKLVIRIVLAALALSAFAYGAQAQRAGGGGSTGDVVIISG